MPITTISSEGTAFWTTCWRGLASALTMQSYSGSTCVRSAKKDDFYHELIQWKIEFLRRYVSSGDAADGGTVGAGKGHGFDYGVTNGPTRRPVWNGDCRAGLVSKAMPIAANTLAVNPTIPAARLLLFEQVRAASGTRASA